MVAWYRMKPRQTLFSLSFLHPAFVEHAGKLNEKIENFRKTFEKWGGKLEEMGRD